MGLLKDMKINSQERYELGGLYFRQVTLGDAIKKTITTEILEIINHCGLSTYHISYSQFKTIHKILYELLDYKGKKPSRKEFEKIISNESINCVMGLCKWCVPFKFQVWLRSENEKE